MQCNATGGFFSKSPSRILISACYHGHLKAFCLFRESYNVLKVLNDDREDGWEDHHLLKRVADKRVFTELRGSSVSPAVRKCNRSRVRKGNFDNYVVTDN